MVPEWLKARLQGRSYTKAIEQLQNALKKKRGDPRLKLQLAEVLIQAKRDAEAATLLEAVADDFALQGMAARAIAVLKRLDKLTPGNAQIEEKLAYLISQEDNPMPSPWRASVAERSASLDIGIEEITDGGFEIGMEAAETPVELAMPPLASRAEADAVSSGVPVPPPAPAPPTPAPVPPPSAPPEPPRSAAASTPRVDADPLPLDPPPAPITGSIRARLDLNDVNVRHEFLTLIDMAFDQWDRETPEPSAAASNAAPSSPLFSDFRPGELVALIRSLALHVFEPGEIVVTEGEPGDSLYVLSSGRARAFTKDGRGRNRQVRDIAEGDVVGEIAVMTGMPRTATITAATRCELLELDRPALDRLAADHPRVREVLQQFYAKHMSGPQG
jgi:hypothetical protein